MNEAEQKQVIAAIIEAVGTSEFELLMNSEKPSQMRALLKARVESSDAKNEENHSADYQKSPA